jgi:hypothetical protein
VEIYAHDENSITNLFFSELYRHGKIKEFLNAIEWRSHERTPLLLDDCRLELHHQLNLSGFGQPDATIILTDLNNEKHVVIIEVKLKDYIVCCGYNLENAKFNNEINTRLNNQLTLRYRAMKAITSLNEKKHITEDKHLPESPYSEDEVRQCKKKKICDLFRPIAKQPFNFYLVVLTTDKSSPFGVVTPSHEFFPIFYDQKEEKIEDFPNLGSINWHACLGIFDDIEDWFCKSFKGVSSSVKKVYHGDRPQPHELWVKGKKIVEYRGQSYLVTCKGFSYALRGVQEGRFVELDRGEKDREKYLSLKDRIKVIGNAPKEPIKNVSFWEGHLLKRSEENKEESNSSKNEMQTFKELPEKVIKILKSLKGYSSMQESGDILGSLKPGDLFKQRQLVEYNGKACLFTRKEWSYKIRGVKGGKFIVLDKGTNDKIKFISLLEKATIIGDAPNKSVGNAVYWKRYLPTVKLS